MPSEEWKIRNFKQKWYAGETISVGIGQGAVATTPIQLARAIGGIGNGGVLYRPHLVFQDQLPSEFQQKEEDAPSEVRVPIDQKNWVTITDAMVTWLTRLVPRLVCTWRALILPARREARRRFPTH
jgi:penicillin-binding protein 2